MLDDFAGLGVGGDHLARFDAGGVLLGDVSQGQTRCLDRGAGLILGLPDDVGNRLGLHASGDDDRDGVAQPHPLADLRLAGNDLACRHRVGVGPCRRAPVEPLLLQGDLRLVLRHADDVGDGHPPSRAHRQIPGGTRPDPGHGQNSNDDGGTAVDPVGASVPGGDGGGLLGVGGQGLARERTRLALSIRSDGADGQGDGAHAGERGGGVLIGGGLVIAFLGLVIDGGAGGLGVGRHDLLGSDRAGPAPAAHRQFGVGELVDDVAQQRQRLIGVCGTLLGLAARHGRHELVDVGRHVGDQLGGQGHVLVDIAEGDLDGGVRTERLLAGQELVEDHPGGEDVGAGGGVSRGDELGRQVGDRAQHIARRRLRHLRDRPGQAEVGHLGHRAVRGQQDVLRLDVPVHQPGPVGGSEWPQQLGHQPQSLLDGQRTRRDEVAQRGPLDILHDEVGDPVEAALVVDGHHARVGQPGRCPRLAAEARDEIGGVRQVGVHELERHGPVQATVVGAVDGGHATAREAVDDLVARVDQPTDEGIRDHGRDSTVPAAARQPLAEVGGYHCPSGGSRPFRVLCQELRRVSRSARAARSSSDAVLTTPSFQSRSSAPSPALR